MEITREAIEQAVESYRQEMLDYCRKLQAKGLLVSGPRDTTLETIEVMDK